MSHRTLLWCRNRQPRGYRFHNAGIRFHGIITKYTFCVLNNIFRFNAYSMCYICLEAEPLIQGSWISQFDSPVLFINTHSDFQVVIFCFTFRLFFSHMKFTLSSCASETIDATNYFPIFRTNSTGHHYL